MKPFNLKQALAGEPILTRDHQKGYVKFIIEDKGNIIKLVGVVNNGSIVEVEQWMPSGNVLSDDIAPNDIIGMWEEPRPRAQLDLPCPLKEPQEGMWYLHPQYVRKSTYSLDTHDVWISNNRAALENGFYFATKEDVHEWLDVMKGARK